MINLLKNILKKYFLYIFLFLVALNYHLYSYIKQPDFYGYLTQDSDSYIQQAKYINQLNFKKIDFTYRTPVYPAFISFFVKNNEVYKAIYYQIFFSALNPIFLYLIIKIITKNNIFSIASSIILLFNYDVIYYQGFIAPEAFTPTLILILIYLHIIQTKKSSIFLSIIIIDTIVILTKPQFVLFPIIFYLIKIIYSKLKIIKQTNIQIYKYYYGLIINSFTILIFCLTNLYFNNTFSFSTVKDINELGKILNYGLMNREYDNPPKLISDTIQAYENSEQVVKNYISPYPVIYKMQEMNILSEPIYPQLKQINNYFIKNNKKEYLRNLNKSFFLNLKINTDNKMDFKNIATYSQKHLFNIKVIFIPSFIIMMTYGAFQTIKKKQESLPIIFIVITILSTAIVNSTTSYLNFARLSVHVSYLMFFVCLYPFYLIISKK